MRGRLPSEASRIDGQTDPELGPGQSYPVGDGEAVRHMAEIAGHVAERGHQSELSESGGKGGQGHADHGTVGPAVEAEPRR